MNEWTDEFITRAQHELISTVDDWKYEYGMCDWACSAMLFLIILRFNPAAAAAAALDENCLDP